MTKRQFFIFTLIPFFIATTASAQVTFTNVTAEMGIDKIGRGGAVWGDYDNDGDADMLLGTEIAGIKLYQNEGGDKFLDVTDTCGIDNLGLGLGMFADFDNDGDLDLFIGSLSGDVLYQNNGNSAFLNISQTAGIELSFHNTSGVIPFDFDNDGLLDIFLIHRQTFTFPNFLYHNEGNGRFQEIAAQVGLDKPEYPIGVALGDYDNDGDLDLFVAHPGAMGSGQGTDVLYRNEEGRIFIDVAKQAGVQKTANHMSAFFWDYDNDEDLDLFVMGLRFGDIDGFNILYRNNGNGTFTDVTQASGIELVRGRNGEAFCWGANCGDYDNDGWLDICITYADIPTQLYHNNGDGTFTEVSKVTGIGGMNSGIVSFLDYDNDGDLDIFTGANSSSINYQPAAMQFSVYRNNGTPNHWLQLKLVGAQSNRDAIGARIKVLSGGLSMLREVARSSGHAIAPDHLPAHFGLGQNRQTDVIEIRWPSGLVQSFTNIPANQRLTIHELDGLLVVVRNVFPSFDNPKGGTLIRIQGEHFLPISRVFFGASEASEVRVVSPELITAVTPPGPKGLVDVGIVHPDGKRGILRNGFRYTTLLVTRITPESGPMIGNITVEIEGFGFQPGAQAQIGDKFLENAFVTPTLIRGQLPPSTPGVVDISVINPDGERNMLRDAFTYIPPPTIEKISPTFAPLMGGMEITINGSGFVRTPTVEIGGAAVLNMEFISANELHILHTSKAFDVGSQDVIVINPDGQRAVLPNCVTILAPIKIKSVEPTSGGLGGGTKITVVGDPTVEVGGRSYPSRFVERVDVFIGDEEAGEVIVQSDHIITAITPPNTPGPKDVEVINPDGQKDTLKNAFLYNPLPQITRVIPDNGRLAGETKISIRGSGFLPGAKVLIGNVDESSFAVASKVQVVSDTLVTALTPSGEPGPKDVVVLNPDRQEVILREGFTYNPMPTIRSISPNHGSTSGGTKLLIEGTGFLQGAKVVIGKRAATTEVKSDSMIEAVVPANPQGVFDVRIINPDTQEAVKHKGFIFVGEVAYNYPNPFRTAQGTTFRYVTNEHVELITVKIFNLRGVPIGVVGQSGSNEVRWYDASVHAGLYVYMMEVRLENGDVKKFRRMLEVYK